MKKLLYVTLSCLAFTTACVTPLPKSSDPLNYQTMSPIRLDVAELSVVNEDMTNSDTRELSGKYGKNPEDTLRDWLANRVVTAGTQGVMNVAIHSANVSVKKLNPEKGINTYFTREQDQVWTATLSATISLAGSVHQYPPAQINISVQASRSIMEKSNAYEKKSAYQDLMNDLISQFNTQAEKQFQTYFNAYRL